MYNILCIQLNIYSPKYLCQNCNSWSVEPSIHPSYTGYPGQEDISIYYPNLTFAESTDDEEKYITTYTIYENYGYYFLNLTKLLV